ncbi:MAG: hypothetical protein M0R32_10100 [Candidatus Cloacimonetes bacterium]|jgi:hypothetical protein|nr:hypothetical protein [Candidatus Cloacimonadota bacterium]
MEESNIDNLAKRVGIKKVLQQLARTKNNPEHTVYESFSWPLHIRDCNPENTSTSISSSPLGIVYIHGKDQASTTMSSESMTFSVDVTESHRKVKWEKENRRSLVKLLVRSRSIIGPL